MPDDLARVNAAIRWIDRAKLTLNWATPVALLAVFFPALFGWPVALSLLGVLVAIAAAVGGMLAWASFITRDCPR